MRENGIIKCSIKTTKCRKEKAKTGIEIIKKHGRY